MKSRLLKPFILLSVMLLLGWGAGVNAAESAVFRGQVTDRKGDPLVGANVLLKENYAGAATNQEGCFYIQTLPGEYTVEISYIGYETVADQVVLKADKSLEKTYRLQIKSFEIGGIVVLAERELIPTEAETKTRISSGEIEHIQATSLSDVLKLVPGQRFENPGLQKTKQVSLRTGETASDAERNATFGTQVIIDGVPISNNANMQIDTKVNTGTIQRTTENSGIDLRQVPADNIEEVEVIRGIPSAKYGDLTSGIVKVETRSESIDQRFKYKYNLRNREFNFNGGFKFLGQYLNYNLNYANSIRDIRIENYDYSRLAGQLSHTMRLVSNLYTTKNRLYYTRTFDEQGLREGDLFLTERYNRDYILRYNHQSQFILSTHQKLDLAYAINYNRQNSYTKRLVTSDNTYITDRMSAGTQAGQFFQTDTSQLWVKGRAINQYANLEYSGSFRLWDHDHCILSGITFRHESNNGPGRIFDPLQPPSVNTAIRDRPRSYDELPGLLISSFFVEDKIKGKLWKPFQLNLGFRYETYSKDYDLFGSARGAFFNPRFNMIFHPTENAQLRIGYGTTSKTPPLSMLYPNPLYYDLADINRYSEVDSLRLAVVSTYVFSRENQNLKGFQQIKREASYDQKIGNIGLTLTAYSANTFDGFARSLIRPIFLYQYDYPNWEPGQPDTTGKTVQDSVYTTYSVFDNTQDTRSQGFEVSLQTKPLSAWSLRFRLEAAYNFTESISHRFDYSSTYLKDRDLGREVKPFWNSVDICSEELLINYRLEFKIRELGAWVTLEAQQVVMDKDRYVGLSDSLAVGYINDHGEKIFFDAAQRTPDMSSAYKRIYPDYWDTAENKTNIWLFNLRVSKALFPGSEVSFFVNNMFNSHPLYQRKRTSAGTQSYTRLNPDLFFGVEFSGVINDWF